MHTFRNAAGLEVGVNATLAEDGTARVHLGTELFEAREARKLGHHLADVAGKLTNLVEYVVPCCAPEPVEPDDTCGPS
jgi:hypothetical protein